MVKKKKSQEGIFFLINGHPILLPRMVKALLTPIAADLKNADFHCSSLIMTMSQNFI